MVVPDGGGGNHKPDGDGEIHEEAGGNIGMKDHITLYFNSPPRNGHAFEHLEKSYRFTAFEPSNPQSTSPGSSTEHMIGGDQRLNGSSFSSQRSSRRFAIPLVRKIDWGSLWDKSKAWIRNPVNMALFAWVVAVGVSGAILFMVMTGMLNRVLKNKSQKDTWFEVNNQILNALFTLMCLYNHPIRFYHLALLCRWRAADMLALRETYCKDGGVKPNERKHMMVVILLLHLNCFAQYALCGLNLGLPRSRRPPVGVGLTISVAICAPAVAGLYNNLSPLGKDYEAQAADEESGSSPQLQRKTIEKRYSFAMTQRAAAAAVEEDPAASAEGDPEWKGGVFDLWDDISLAYLAMFCSCCVFGWNAGRLGFGNMYVHTVTFILFCLAPFFIFNLAAINIDNEDVRDALGIGGALLCVLGLLYGGFWRIQMRRRFRLPANDLCCGKPDVTDCFQWLCCCPCSLAQEVRTADAYQIVQEDRISRLRCRGDDEDPSAQMPSHHGDDMQQQHQQQQAPRFAGGFAPDGVTDTTPPAVPVAIHH